MKSSSHLLLHRQMLLKSTAFRSREAGTGARWCVSHGKSCSAGPAPCAPEPKLMFLNAPKRSHFFDYILSIFCFFLFIPFVFRLLRFGFAVFHAVFICLRRFLTADLFICFLLLSFFNLFIYSCFHICINYRVVSWKINKEVLYLLFRNYGIEFQQHVKSLIFFLAPITNFIFFVEGI